MCRARKSFRRFWMSFRTYIPNPKGLGGFQFRPHDMMVVGAPNSPKCGAVTRRTGLPCRNIPVRLKPGGRCDKHGGKSTQAHAPVLAKNDRQHHSKSVALIRRVARETLKNTTLHPDTMKTVAPYLDTIYEPDAERVILACNDWLCGGFRESFEATLAMARQHNGPRNLKPARWKRKTPLAAASKPASMKPASKPESEAPIEAQPIDRRYAARPTSPREPYRENWSPSRDSKKNQSGF